MSYDKRKIMRNLIDPELGLHIFNAAKISLGISIRENRAQLQMFGGN